MFEMKLNWWDANVNFTQRFKLNKREGAKVVANVAIWHVMTKTANRPRIRL